MSNKTTPMLYLNLAGEMLYVLDQRLRTQDVELDKGTRVMCDIIAKTFDSDILHEAYKNQPVFSKKDLASIFEKLVNVSIMKVDPESMEKLYDLMLMTFKHQVINSRGLTELVHVSLNHLDSMLKFVGGKPELKNTVEAAFRHFVEHCNQMSAGELILAKQTILSFLIDLKSKVSILISMGDQNKDGSFIIGKNAQIPTKFEVPGTIRYIDDGRVEYFESGVNYTTGPVLDASTDLGGDRLTSLGLNLYMSDSKSRAEYQPSFVDAESKLLGHLLGASQPRSDLFTLNLFGPDPLELAARPATVDKKCESETRDKHVNIKVETVQSQHLSDIKKDFGDIDLNTGVDDDLLTMMDNA